MVSCLKILKRLLVPQKSFIDNEVGSVKVNEIKFLPNSVSVERTPGNTIIQKIRVIKIMFFAS